MMNDVEIQLVYEYVKRFLDNLKVPHPNLTSNDLSSFKSLDLHSLFTEIFQRENIKWQDFYDYFITNYGVNKEEDLLVVKKFFLENNVQIIEPSKEDLVDAKTLQRFDFYLYDTFNKSLSDRILLYVKALYLQKYIEKDPEEFVQSPFAQIYGTLLELVKDEVGLSDNEKKLRRVVREFIYEVFPEVKTKDQASNTLAFQDKVQKYTTTDDLVVAADESLTKAVEGIPLEFPYNEYKVGNDLLPPERSLEMDKWMLTAGIVGQDSTVRPELLFSNIDTPVSPQLSAILQKAIAQKSYEEILKQNLKASFKGTPADLDPATNDILIDTFSKDIAQKIVETQSSDRINPFEAGLALLTSFFDNKKNTEDYVKYVVNKKLKETDKNKGLVDQNGMFHEGAASSAEYRNALAQTLPGAFDHGMKKSIGDYKNFPPGATKLSQFDHIGNFSKGGVGELVTPNLNRAAANPAKFADSYTRSPINAIPSLSSQVKNSFGDSIPKSELRNLQKSAFHEGEVFRNAAFRSPNNNHSPLNNFINSHAPSVNRLPEYRREGIGNNLAKNVGHYAKNANTGSAFDRIGYDINHGIGRASQGLGGAKYSPKSPPFANAISAGAKAPTRALPKGFKNRTFDSAARNDLQRYRAAQASRGGRRQQVPRNFPNQMVRGGQAAEHGARRGAEEREGIFGYAVAGGIVTSAFIGSGGLVPAVSAFTFGLTGYIPRLVKDYESLMKHLQTTFENKSMDTQIVAERLRAYLQSNPSTSISSRAAIANFVGKLDGGLTDINGVIQYTTDSQGKRVIARAPGTVRQVYDKNKGRYVDVNDDISSQLSKTSSNFKARIKNDRFTFVSSVTGTISTVFGTLFSRGGYINGTIGFAQANMMVMGNLTTFARWNIVNAIQKRKGTVGNSKSEKFLNFLIGRHLTDASLVYNLNGRMVNMNTMFGDIKRRMGENAGKAYRTSAWDLRARWRLSRESKKLQKELERLTGAGILMRGQSWFGKMSWALGVLSDPLETTNKFLLKKAQAFALDTLKKLYLGFLRKMFVGAVARFGAASLFSRLIQGAIGFASGGVGAIVFAVITSSKTLMKYLGALVFVLFAILCMACTQFAAIFGTLGTTYGIGGGIGEPTAGEKATGGITLTNTFSRTTQTPGGLGIATVEFASAFSFAPKADTPVNYPNGILYAGVSFPGVNLNRPDYDVVLNGTTFSQDLNLFLLEKMPIDNARAIGGKNYNISIKINDKDKFKANVTKEKPFCLTVAYVDKEITESTDLANVTSAALAKKCVDGNGEPIGNNGFTCPIEGPLTCTYGSKDPDGGDVGTHAVIKAMDLGQPAGTPIKSPVNGTIIERTEQGYCGGNSAAPYGGILRIKGEDNRIYVFIHVSDMQVTNGATVTKGQQVAKIWGYNGKNGCWTGAHVHTEVFGEGYTKPISDPSKIKDRAYPEAIYTKLLGCNIANFKTKACANNVNQPD